MSPSRPAMPPNATPVAALRRWLLVVAGMVLLMVVVGGITRLTESGLSITEWKPLAGIIPPLNAAQWQGEFAHYRAIDQYAAIHSGITLTQFQALFFWEYGHRLLGRLVGLVAAGGWLWFALQRQIPAGYGARLFLVPVMIGIQGVLGWLMVASGLRPGMVEVAPGWLAAHLVTALLTLAVTLWLALDLKAPEAPARLTGLGALVGAMLAVQLVYGALMAGLRAGRVADQWPLMNGAIWPGPTQAGRGLWADLTADPAVVHFIHRWWALAVFAGVMVCARRLRGAGARAHSIALHTAIGTQIVLGIATVMAGVPLWLAALHQLTGALVVVAVVCAAHELGRALPSSAPRCAP